MVIADLFQYSIKVLLFDVVRALFIRILWLLTFVLSNDSLVTLEFLHRGGSEYEFVRILSYIQSEIGIWELFTYLKGFQIPTLVILVVGRNRHEISHRFVLSIEHD